MPQPPAVVVAGRYRLKKLLGAGSYGKVYSAHDQGQADATDHKDVAIKISKHSLQHEIAIYSLLQTYAFCPKLHTSGVAGKFHYLVFDRCGPSIEGTYALDVVLRIGLHLLQMLRDLHAAGIVHGDLKPSNILWRSMREEERQGLGPALQGPALQGPALQGPAPLVLIDYGLAQVMDGTAPAPAPVPVPVPVPAPVPVHVPVPVPVPVPAPVPVPVPVPVVFQGNYKFASLRQHEHTSNEHTSNDDTCAVDDVESLGYILIYLLGYLPWLGTDAPSEIAHKKLNVHLYTVIPGEFITWLQYCQRLTQGQRPNYVYLRNLVGNLYVLQK